MEQTARRYTGMTSVAAKKNAQSGKGSGDVENGSSTGLHWIYMKTKATTVAASSANPYPSPYAPEGHPLSLVIFLHTDADWLSLVMGGTAQQIFPEKGEEFHGRIISRMQLAAELESATATMRRNGVRAPVSLQHNLPVWLDQLWNSVVECWWIGFEASGRRHHGIAPSQILGVNTYALPDWSVGVLCWLRRCKRRQKENLVKMVRKCNKDRVNSKTNSTPLLLICT